MSIQDVRAAAVASVELPMHVIPKLIIAAGVLFSLYLGALGLLQEFGVYESKVGFIIADTYMNGEKNWDATRHQHGEWGDTLFLILGTPMLLSMFCAVCVTPFVQADT